MTNVLVSAVFFKLKELKLVMHAEVPFHVNAFSDIYFPNQHGLRDSGVKNFFVGLIKFFCQNAHTVCLSGFFRFPQNSFCFCFYVVLPQITRQKKKSL